MGESEHRGRPDGSRESAPPTLPVLDASPNAIVAVGADGRIAYANPRVLDTFGHRPEDLIGRPIEVLIPDRLVERHVGHRQGFLSMPTARPMGIGLALSGRRADGTEFPVEISLSPVDTDEGRRVYATVVDITARKAAEDALAESERRFRTVLEAAPNAILAVDETGLIGYANPQVEATFGYTRDELVGLPLETLLPERVRERHVGHRREFREHPTSRPMGIGLDLAGRRRDGTEFPVEISLSPVDTPDGRVVFATVVDITARKSLEGELLQAQKMESIGRLAGGIAHDFNNILSAIQGHAELILSDLAPSAGPPQLEEVTDSARAIRGAAERAASLTRQLLAFSRQQVLAPTVVELDQVVHEVEPMLRRLIGENVRLVLALDPATGRLRADRGQLDQILVNLVVNARDALEGGGTITIETSNTMISEPYAAEHFDVAPGRYVMLAVSDDGVGMDRATREHIFEPFFTTKELGKGTGLGLATIYGIVRQSGGHIWLYSEPGLGTAFKLYFPQVDEALDVVEPAPTAAPARAQGTVLVAEDEEDVRDIIVKILRRAGYTVTAAATGQEALAIAEATQFDVLVSDVIMPGMTGPELAGNLLGRRAGVGVVLLSGYTAEALDLAELLAQGVQFLSKPFAAADLLAAVRVAIQAASTSP